MNKEHESNTVGSVPTDRREMGRLAMLRRSFHHRNYRLFFAGQLVSLIGTWMQMVAQSWLVYRLTGSAALLGLVGFASQIPVMLFSPLGGAVADRSFRRRILLITQASSMLLALLLAVLTLTGVVRIWEIFALASLLGIVNAFDIPARQSFVVEMVGRKDMPNAIALNSSMFNGARIVGPALAGITVAAVGEGWCFLLNAVSYLAVLIALLAMQLPAHKPAPKESKMLSHVIEGLAYVARTRSFRSILMLLGLSSLTGMSYVVLMPVFAHEVLNGGPKTLGALMGAAGFGALLAALTLAMRPSLKGIINWIANGALGFGASLMLFAFSSNVWVSALLLVAVGYAMMIQMAASNTLIQSMVPDAYRGRTMAAHAMVFLGMAPVGALLAGLAAERFGAPRAVELGGVMCILGALLFRRGLPILRNEIRNLVHTQATLHEAEDAQQNVIGAP